MKEVSTKSLHVRRSQRIAKGKAHIRYVNENLEKPSWQKSYILWKTRAVDDFHLSIKKKHQDLGIAKSWKHCAITKKLKGKAKESVSSLLTFTQEVDKITDNLEKGYGRAEIVIQDIIDSMRKIPDLKKERLDTVLDSNRIYNLTNYPEPES
ncbi:hypothetical protein JTB14_012106 [Gonioctena quinquepunctata]|nr:hypothetical protein JTB14_012106 [Gonioctena quinquepunctata]